MNLSIAAGIVINLARIAYDPQWFVSLLTTGVIDRQRYRREMAALAAADARARPLAAPPDGRPA